jgi:hypothetical protein
MRVMGEPNRFEAWKQKQKSDLHKALQSKDLSKDEKQDLFGQVQLSVEASDIAFRYLETAREIGATILPSGTASNVIEIAELLHEIERDIIEDSRYEEPGSGGNQTDPDPEEK